MAGFIKNKQLYVLADDSSYQGFYTVNNEMFLTADRIRGLFSFEEFSRAVRSPISIRVHRIHLLNFDDTIRRDVSEYVTSCSVNLSYGSGATHSVSVSFINTDGMWTPNPVKGFLWKGSKFKVEAGLFYNGTVFWDVCGIFTPTDPTIDYKAQTVQTTMKDKFAFLDGTVSGKIDSDFKISVGTPVKTAIEMCLVAEKENGGVYDVKPIIFPADKENILTPYTIKKAPDLTYGEIIIELAKMISCNASYNSNGNLVIEGDSDESPFENRTILWHFDDSVPLTTKPSITMEMSKIINKVTVVGAIENGYRFKGVAINDRAKSQTNIYMTEPNPLYIEDSKLRSDQLCQHRAEYELKNQSLLYMQAKFDSVFIPGLRPGNLVAWTSKEHGFAYEKFFINTVDFDVVNPTVMSLSLTNVNDVIIKK